MTPGKRALDLALALPLCVLLAVPMLVLVAAMLLIEGRPVFYLSERMATPTRPFRLIKLRSMRPPATADLLQAGLRRPATAEGAAGLGEGVTGGDKAARMSRLHRALRRTRADEVPQLWNVIRGDMSLVGPRPPLRTYAEAFPALYGEVLKSRPGITGLASLRFHAREERLLAACRTPAETDRVYRRRCVPRKARLDLIYQRRRSLWLDLRLLAETAATPFRRA